MVIKEKSIVKLIKNIHLLRIVILCFEQSNIGDNLSYGIDIRWFFLYPFL